MHPEYRKADSLSNEVIGASIEVHRQIGPGLIESVYQKCLSHELKLRNIQTVNEVIVPIEYKGHEFDERLRIDLLVGGCLIIELKVVKEVLPVHKAQVYTYMRLTDAPVGLILNFHEPLMKNGIDRLILPNANKH